MKHPVSKGKEKVKKKKETKHRLKGNKASTQENADSSRYPSKVIDPISRRSTCIGRFAECRAARGVGLTGQIGHVDIGNCFFSTMPLLSTRCTLIKRGGT